MASTNTPGQPEDAANAADSRLSPAKLAEKRRLAEALSVNLRRRKAQAKARAAESDVGNGEV